MFAPINTLIPYPLHSQLRLNLDLIDIRTKYASGRTPVSGYARYCDSFLIFFVNVCEFVSLLVVFLYSLAV